MVGPGRSGVTSPVQWPAEVSRSQRPRWILAAALACAGLPMLMLAVTP